MGGGRKPKLELASSARLTVCTLYGNDSFRVQRADRRVRGDADARPRRPFFARMGATVSTSARDQAVRVVPRARAPFPRVIVPVSTRGCGRGVSARRGARRRAAERHL